MASHMTEDESAGGTSSIVWDNKAIDQLLDRSQEDGDSDKPQQDWFANEYLSSFKVQLMVIIGNKLHYILLSVGCQLCDEREC